MCQHQIPLDTVSAGVHDSEHELGSSVPLLGGQLNPAYGLFIVLRNAVTIVVHPSEVELSGGITLLGARSYVLQR